MLDEVVADRAAAIAALDGPELARRIALQPHLAAWCTGTGPLRVWLGSSTRNPGRKQLAGALANPHVQRLTMELLDPATGQLMVVIASHGGSIHPDVLAIELEPVEPDERERMVRGLVDRFLLHELEPGEPLRLRPGVSEMTARPGRPLDRLVLDQSITKETIGGWLQRLSTDKPPAGKTARIDALRRLIGTPEGILSVLDRLDPHERQLFARLVKAGGRGMNGDLLTANWWQLRLYHPYEQRPTAVRPHMTPEAQALQFFIDHGLVWVEREIRQVGLWLETLTAVNGRTFATWPSVHTVAPTTLSHHAHAHPEALSTLQSLLRHVAVEPLPGLKNGGIGVKVVRDLAKRLGQPVDHLGPLLNLALGLGLVVQMSEFIGRGRNANWVHRYEMGAEAAAEWRRLSIADQWIRLVDAWLDGLDGPGETRSIESVVRRQIVADLLALPDGHGIPADQLIEWCHERHVMARRSDLTGLRGQLVILGLTAADGPVGFGPLARAVITEPGALHDLLPEHDTSFVVQADLSIIAPPGLDPAIRARLDRLCIAESSGSVSVLRLDRTRIAAEMAAGETSQRLLDFLNEHSSVPVAPVVAQMLADVERQRGGLSVRPAATIVTADDVLGLANAVKVKAAKLTLIAPTIAVSDLPHDKVMAALRKAGLAPATDVEQAPPPEMVSRVQPRPKPRNVPEVLHPHVAQLEALMEGW
jgi:hypothetical protein